MGGRADLPQVPSPLPHPREARRFCEVYAPHVRRALSVPVLPGCRGFLPHPPSGRGLSPGPRLLLVEPSARLEAERLEGSSLLQLRAVSGSGNELHLGDHLSRFVAILLLPAPKSCYTGVMRKSLCQHRSAQNLSAHSARDTAATQAEPPLPSCSPWTRFLTPVFPGPEIGRCSKKCWGQKKKKKKNNQNFFLTLSSEETVGERFSVLSRLCAQLHTCGQMSVFM